MAARQTRRQLQFTGFEMAMIAVSFVATVTAVFFLGLYVGKKNASYHVPPDDRVARVPVDDFTKYKRPEPIPAAPKPVHAADADKPVVVASATAPAPLAASVKAAAPAVDAARPADTTDVGPSAAAMPVAAARDATKDAAKEAAKPPSDPSRDAAAAKAKEVAAAKEAAAKEAAKQKEKEKELAEPATGRGYTVQILQTRKQAEADALVAKLKAHGLAAYIKKISEGEGASFRVRVGSYGSFSDAHGVADRCHRELGLGQAFVSTE